MRFLSSLALGAALVSPTIAMAEVPRVVATIKPVHALVAAVMGDLGIPTLIVRSGASPHTYSLRPSDAGAIEAAGLVFWTGRGMELFLESALETLAVKAKVVELAESPGIQLLPTREGGAFEAHGQGEGEEPTDRKEEHDGESAHDHEADMHFWLDPVNAGLMVDAIAAALSEADPENASAYAANADAEKADLAALTAEIQAALGGVKSKPFIVFHDAYQYFERRFGLAVAGAVTVTPGTMPGAARIGELKRKIADSGARCVFAEPRFEPAIISAIIEGTGARAGELDPEGASLPEGPGLYRQLLENLATGLTDCLAP
ncbi:MAG: zinc ABC transporter substrate-binding protein [Devosia sp.]|nr:zinc ABC transporter substrate-binding protein [Devosia sp.]